MLKIDFFLNSESLKHLGFSTGISFSLPFCTPLPQCFFREVFVKYSISVGRDDRCFLERPSATFGAYFLPLLRAVFYGEVALVTPALKMILRRFSCGYQSQ
jgi:hypothetical protein